MSKTKLFIIRRLIITFTLIFAGVIMSEGQTTAFNYQGRFTDATQPQPTNGTYQMQFALYDAATEGTQIGTTLTNPTVQVANGIFSVSLNFTAVNAFDGTARFLEIRVFNSATNNFVTLNPRQQLMSSPYSVRALSASSADGLSNLCVGCIDDAKIATVSGSKITGPVNSALNADNLTTTLPIEKGGTGSTTKNFVDLTTAQTIGGNKTFTDNLAVNGAGGLNVTTGNLGLGTVSPQARLDVRGNIKLGSTGNLFALGGEDNLRVIRGIVQIGNGTATILEGSGFTATRLNTGHVRISFNTFFQGFPVVIPSVIDAGDKFANVTAEGFDRVDIVIRNSSGLLIDPSYVTFVAIGPR